MREETQEYMRAHVAACTPPHTYPCMLPRSFTQSSRLPTPSSLTHLQADYQGGQGNLTHRSEHMLGGSPTARLDSSPLMKGQERV